MWNLSPGQNTGLTELRRKLNYRNEQASYENVKSLMQFSNLGLDQIGCALEIIATQFFLYLLGLQMQPDLSYLLVEDDSETFALQDCMHPPCLHLSSQPSGH